MAKIMAVANQKGGVGKTTTTVNLGVAMANTDAGKKVLLVDADPQGSLTLSLGQPRADELPLTIADLFDNYVEGEDLRTNEVILHHEEGVDFIPSNIKLSSVELRLINAVSREMALHNILNEVTDDYDYILIDCMPSLGIVTMNAFAVAHTVLIPVQPQYLSAMGMTELFKSIIKIRKSGINPRLGVEGIILTMTDNTNNSRQAIELIQDNYGEMCHIFDTVIPRRIAATEASHTGKSIFSLNRKNPVAIAYEDIAMELTI
jgi:chromosome partitioning protein